MRVETETLPGVEKPDVLTSLDNLYQIVPSPEKRMGISSELLNTAGHEFNHYYAAMKYGARVLKLSVLPDGNSQGRTEFAGILSPDTVKVIAAAGAVATHDGCACGYASDLNKVNLLTYHFGGISEQKALSTAESLILGCPLGIRRTMAEIIAYKRELSEEDLQLSMLVAKIEEDVKSGMFNYELYGDIKVDEKSKQPEENMQGKTIIEHLPNGYQRVIYVVEGKTKTEKLICSLCLGVDGHDESCPRHEKQLHAKEITIFPRIRS